MYNVLQNLFVKFTVIGSVNQIDLYTYSIHTLFMYLCTGFFGYFVIPGV